MSSLRRRVAQWLLPLLIGLLLVNAWDGQRTASQAVNRAYDRGLQASAQLIAERTYSTHGQVVVDIPYAALDVSNERVFYGVFWPDGEAITGYEDLPRPLPAGGDVAVSDAVYRDVPVRLVAMRKKLYDPEQNNASSVIVVVAETVDGRAALARDILLDGMRRQGLLVLVGLLLMWVIISRALRPMTLLGEAFARRREDDLTPVATDGIAAEVRPMIDAVNHHMQRIEAMLQARKRFVADAAHQLRTPLAVLRTQIDYGLRQHTPGEMRAAIEGVGQSVRHMQRLTDQLLSLSSAEAVNGLAREREPVDMVALVRDVAGELSLLAIERRIDLGFETGHDPVPLVWGHAALLREMVLNLLDNALRYTPSQGAVTARVTALSDMASAQGEGAAGRRGVCLCVTDTGPGIPSGERSKVFHRFYRILGGPRTEGSGLGLAIVREIVQAHAGRVSLENGEAACMAGGKEGACQGPGLTVRVTLPPAP